MFFWSLNVIVARYFANIFTPWQISFYRWFFAAIILIPFVIKDIITRYKVKDVELLNKILESIPELHTCIGKMQYGAHEFDVLKQFGLRENDVKVTETPEILFARLKVEEIVEKAEAMYAARRAEAEAPAAE